MDRINLRENYELTSSQWTTSQTIKGLGRGKHRECIIIIIIISSSIIVCVIGVWSRLLLPRPTASLPSGRFSSGVTEQERPYMAPSHRAAQVLWAARLIQISAQTRCGA